MVASNNIKDIKFDLNFYASLGCWNTFNYKKMQGCCTFNTV